MKKLKTKRTAEKTVKKMLSTKEKNRLIEEALELILPDKSMIMDQVEEAFHDEGYPTPSWKEVVKEVKKNFQYTD
jgi:hypothetical protein